MSALSTSFQRAGIGACVFDAYGTLFDVNSAARRCRDEVGDGWEALGDLWRAKQIQYTWLRSLMGRYVDFEQVTAEALDFALEGAGMGAAPADLRERLMEHYLRLDAYPEVAGVLARLKGAGMATAILSNRSPAMLATMVGHAGIGGDLDDVLSVDAIGVYKPAPEVYQMAVDRFGLAPERIAFLSSNGWDAAGAAAFGFQVAWVNRTGQPAERLPAPPGAVLETLAGLPGLLGLGAD